MSEKLNHAKRHCSDVLDQLLEQLFEPHCKLTLIMRNPDEDDGHLIITDDDLEDVADVVLHEIKKEEEEACRSFDPWSCDEGPDGEPVDRDLCMVCGLAEGSHEAGDSEREEIVKKLRMVANLVEMTENVTYEEWFLNAHFKLVIGKGHEKERKET